MNKKPANPNATKENVFEQIEKYGPVSAKAIASALNIDEIQVQQRISYMVCKSKINIQKEGSNRNKQYFYDPEFPIIGAPSITEQEKQKEEDDLFDELNSEEELIAPLEPLKVPKKSQKGLDSLVDRCHHLIMALELCSSCTIMDSFNLDEEQARVLVNKVAARFSDVNVSFSVKLVKEK